LTFAEEKDVYRGERAAWSTEEEVWPDRNGSGTEDSSCQQIKTKPNVGTEVLFWDRPLEERTGAGLRESPTIVQNSTEAEVRKLGWEKTGH